MALDPQHEVITEYLTKIVAQVDENGEQCVCANWFLMNRHQQINHFTAWLATKESDLEAEKTALQQSTADAIAALDADIAVVQAMQNPPSTYLQPKDVWTGAHIPAAIVPTTPPDFTPPIDAPPPAGTDVQPVIVTDAPPPA